MEVGGVDPSDLGRPVLGLPGRLRASRRIPAARPFSRSSNRAKMGRRSGFDSPTSSNAKTSLSGGFP